MLTQVFGITTVEDAELVVDAGADHLGLVLAQGVGTHDEVGRDEASAILEAVRGRITTVCLLFDHEIEPLAEAVELLRPDVLHLPLWTDEYPPGKLTLLRSAIPDTRVMVTIPVDGPDAVELAVRFDGAADFFLLDTIHPETGRVGATGHVHDWSLSRQIVERVEHPVILAGGLGPDNVAEAIERVGPAGVDSQTGTTRPDDPRRKDRDRVRAFVDAAQRAADAHPR